MVDRNRTPPVPARSVHRACWYNAYSTVLVPQVRAVRSPAPFNLAAISSAVAPACHRADCSASSRHPTDCRTIATFGARIWQTARKGCVTFEGG